MVLMIIGWAGTNHLPNMKFKDLKNKKQNLSQYYSDGPILLNFWNLACEPCKKEMKELVTDVLLLEREHQISKIDIVKKIADKINASGQIYYRNDST